MVCVFLESLLPFIHIPPGETEDGFATVCEVEADLSGLSGALEKCHGPRGVYWKLEYDIGLMFGATELAAILFWKENVCDDTMLPRLMVLNYLWQGRERESKSIIPKQYARFGLSYS